MMKIKYYSTLREDPRIGLIVPITETQSGELFEIVETGMWKMGRKFWRNNMRLEDEGPPLYREKNTTGFFTDPSQLYRTVKVRIIERNYNGTRRHA
jgi:hypothetical protein